MTIQVPEGPRGWIENSRQQHSSPGSGQKGHMDQSWVKGYWVTRKSGRYDPIIFQFDLEKHFWRPC